MRRSGARLIGVDSETVEDFPFTFWGRCVSHGVDEGHALLSVRIRYCI